MRARLVAAISMGAVVVSACTAGSPDGAREEGGRNEPLRAPLPTETLLLDTGEGPVAVHAPDGSVVLSVPGAVTGRDGSIVYSTERRGRATLLRSASTATGAPLSSVRIRGDLRVRIVSGSGRAAALMQPLPAGWDPWTPIPRARTQVVVADPTREGEARRYVLAGNYEPEAFSTDDRTLFLIQHLPAEAPIVYRVVKLDLRSGRVLPVFGPFKAPSERMPGTRLEQAASPDGAQLYTLYSSARPGYAPHAAPVTSSAVVAFVHVLDLEEGWAHCVGLPEALWDRPASQQALAPSPDGRYLYVIDAGLRVLAVMDTETLEVRSGGLDLPRASAIRRTTAAVAADGRTLFVATGGASSTVTAIDLATFDALGDWTMNGIVSGLGLSSDGAAVYAALENRVAVLDPASGSELGVVPLVTPGPVTGVLALGG